MSRLFSHGSATRRSIQVLGVIAAAVFFVGVFTGRTPHAAVPQPQAPARGDVASGRDVFRFETFGNEGFWTDAMRMPKGVLDSLTLGGKTIGRAPTGLTASSTETEVDAYLSNPAFYPVGTFDETQDGIGNSVLNTPLFRQNLAAPYGSAGEFAELLDISNGSYTTNLDPTTLVTPEGRAFLKMRAGALGEELADNYAKILADTGVKGFPFVKATMTGKVGVPTSLVGRRVDEQKLRDLKAYLDALPGPKAPRVDQASAARGQKMFSQQCSRSHTLDPNQPVAKRLIDLKELWPGYAPIVLAKRASPLSPVQDSPGTFDDKMIVIDASDRDRRGNALPLLLDLARKEVFLHDASVPGLDALLDSKRGPQAPHAFYVPDSAGRRDVIAFLHSLEVPSNLPTARARPQ